jgi:CRISPR-associated protein Cmr1
MATERIEVNYRVVTPLFCGGAKSSIAELRLPSFKGVLRWWWRALAWSRYQGDLSRVQADEDALFGSARRGQGKVVMRLLPSDSQPPVVKVGEVLTLDGRVIGEGARYLGYGVMETYGSTKKGTRDGQLTHGCLHAPFDFGVELRIRDVADEAQRLVLDALKAVGLLGGIGAKSRKGYGSLVLRSISIDGWSAPMSASDLKGAIRELLSASGKKPSNQDDLPPYTAVSSRTRIVLVPADGHSEPLALLDRIGREMMRFRSWGHNGKVLRDDREANFKDDHDLMKKHPDRRSTHPRRIVFGLPHNYGKNDYQQVDPADDRYDRRASPLLIHIHECDTTRVAVLSALPAQFLPGGDAAQVNVGGKRVNIAAEQELWGPLDVLLKRFLGSPERKEPFGQTMQVFP